MHFIIIFFATFSLVFALGFQNLTLIRGHYKTAVVNSIFISAANLAILKFVPEANSFYDYVAFMTGGPFGIAFSIYAHNRFFLKNKRHTKRFKTFSNAGHTNISIKSRLAHQIPQK